MFSVVSLDIRTRNIAPEGIYNKMANLDSGMDLEKVYFWDSVRD